MKNKIFVTVGSTYPLDRLIKEIETLNKDKFEIFAQIGESKLNPELNYKKFLNYKEIQNKIKWADIVISHAGIGTILDAVGRIKINHLHLAGHTFFFLERVHH